MSEKKNKPGFGKRLRQAIVHLCGGTIIENWGEPVQSGGWQDDKFMFDFKPMFSAPVEFQFNGNIISGGGTFIGESENSNSEKKKEKTIKIAITPKEALAELERVPTNFSLANLDDKIAVLKEKEKLIKQTYANREIQALIERLENRKKYNEHKEFFDSFDNTTQEKIDALIAKTGLVMKESDIFIPEFPDDAVKVMKDYTEKIQVLCGKKPVFYVIAEAKDFKSAYEKRDPILLVQSPFGFYYQILGAWDQEMLLLSEL